MQTMQSKLRVTWMATFGVAAALATSTAWAEAPAGSSTGQETALNGLGDELNRTGRFATVPVTPVGEITPADRTRGGHGEVRVRSVPADSSVKEASAPATESVREFQYNKALTAAEDCRFDVARRRGVVPQNVPAGTVTVRWTIEATGAVRDAEAISVHGTDPEVAACAKRVLTGWHFLRPAGGQVVVERTLTFRPLP
jgi:hypothetical protein